ncbi:MAG: Fe-S-containing hydro-lyase [Clostridia bacterium]|nr:Fe-S-containing hydro-lyase [Clostridia bacterium]
MENIRVQLPLNKEEIAKLRAGDTVLLTGIMYTARDAAHKRLVACLDEGREMPFDVKNQLIYYVGPAPASPGHAVGSAGPTTSYRMDAYAPRLLDEGLLGMMGKGKRNDKVIESMKKNGAVYFGAVGGAAALISQKIEKSEVVAYEDLGAEAIHRFTVKDFPALVIIDSLGNNVYMDGPRKYAVDPDQ